MRAFYEALGRPGGTCPPATLGLKQTKARPPLFSLARARVLYLIFLLFKAAKNPLFSGKTDILLGQNQCSIGTKSVFIGTKSVFVGTDSLLCVPVFGIIRKRDFAKIKRGNNEKYRGRKKLYCC